MIKSDLEDLYSCHFYDLVIKIPYFWSYNTFCSEIVSRNGIIIFLLYRSGKKYTESSKPGIRDINNFCMK